MSKRIIIENEEEYEYLKQCLKKDKTNENPEFKKPNILRKLKRMILINNKIYIKLNNMEDPLEYLEDYNNELKKEKIQKVHLISHRGRDAFFNELKQKYYNVKRKEIEEVLKKCSICIERKVITRIEKIKPKINNKKYERFAIDITYMEEYKEYNQDYKYILTVIDAPTKFEWEYPCITESASEVYCHLDLLFFSCNVPKTLHFDNVGEF